MNLASKSGRSSLKLARPPPFSPHLDLKRDSFALKTPKICEQDKLPTMVGIANYNGSIPLEEEEGSDDSFTLSICQGSMDTILNYRCLYHPLKMAKMIPKPIEQSAVINNQIYFLGGSSDNIEVTAIDLLTWFSSCQFSVAPVKPVKIRYKPAMPTRSSFTCVANRADGNLYLFGGARGVVTFNDVWIFNLANRQWKCLEPVSIKKPPVRCGHSAVIYKGKMYIYGGRSMGQNEHSLYEATISQVTSRMYTPTPQKDFTTLQSFDYSGSMESGFQGTNSMVDTFSTPKTTNSSGRAPSRYSRTTSFRQKWQSSIYRYSDLWSFDLVAHEWIDLTPTRGHIAKRDIPSARDDHSAIVIGHAMYIFGGMRNYVGIFPRILNDLWVYDFDKKYYKKLQPKDIVPPPRQRHCCLELEGNLVIQGGDSGDGVGLNDTWEFQFNTSSWRRIRDVSLGTSPTAICGGINFKCNPCFASLIGISVTEASGSQNDFDQSVGDCLSHFSSNSSRVSSNFSERSIGNSPLARSSPNITDTTVSIIHTTSQLFIVRFEAPPVCRWIATTRRLSLRNHSLLKENTRLQTELNACHKTLTQQILQHNLVKAKVLLEQRKFCLVCCTNDVQYAFDPCGHACTCEECAIKLLEEQRSNCPMCRTAISHALRIHF